MFRSARSLVLPMLFVAGCHARTMIIFEDGMPPIPAKPAPFPQMKMLEPMVGTWTSSGEMVDPDPEEIRAMLPESDRANFKSSFGGGSTNKMILDGAVFQTEGWYEMPDNQKGTYIEMWTWDPCKQAFRTWFTSNYLETGTGWATPSADGRCFHVRGSAYDANCMKKKFEGCMCIPDNDTTEWHFTEKGPMGRMTMHGKSTRQK